MGTITLKSIGSGRFAGLVIANRPDSAMLPESSISPKRNHNSSCRNCFKWKD
jgi:hypothetical protein